MEDAAMVVSYFMEGILANWQTFILKANSGLKSNSINFTPLINIFAVFTVEKVMHFKGHKQSDFLIKFIP
jgi:hypothetical protein